MHQKEHLGCLARGRAFLSTPQVQQRMVSSRRSLADLQDPAFLSTCRQIQVPQQVPARHSLVQLPPQQAARLLPTKPVCLVLLQLQCLPQKTRRLMLLLLPVSLAFRPELPVQSA